MLRGVQGIGGQSGSWCIRVAFAIAILLSYLLQSNDCLYACHALLSLVGRCMRKYSDIRNMLGRLSCGNRSSKFDFRYSSKDLPCWHHANRFCQRDQQLNINQIRENPTLIDEIVNWSIFDLVAGASCSNPVAS